MKRTPKLAGPAGFLIVILVFVFAISACETQGPKYVDELDLVVTTPDTSFNFQSIKYYYMPDTVVFITDKEEEEPGDGDPHRFDEEILAAVASNMDAKGYERVDENGPNDYDVIILISTLSTRYVGIYWWENWWNWWGWGGWYPPGWNPWYPWVGQVYTWTTGTVIIDMLNPEGPFDNEQIPALWNAMFNGLLQGSDSYILGRIKSNIDQAFLQSDYLGTPQVTPQ